MSEWGVVGVIIALVGLGAAIIKPILSLNTSIVKLTAAVENLQEDLRESTTKNSKAHERLWDHNEKQDKTLDDHEKRIVCLEHREE